MVIPGTLPLVSFLQAMGAYALKSLNRADVDLESQLLKSLPVLRSLDFDEFVFFDMDFVEISHVLEYTDPV